MRPRPPKSAAIGSTRRSDADSRRLRLCDPEPTTRSGELAQRREAEELLSDMRVIEQCVALLRGAMPPENVERLQGDAELAVKHLAPGSYFRSAALYVLEITSLLAGNGDSPKPAAGQMREPSDRGNLPLGELDFRVRCAATLTAAELRLLPYLATQLSYREIGERLFIARSTVKSEAISAYRKLRASSRSEAVEHAAELGLIEATAATQSGDLGNGPRTLAGILAGPGAGAMLSAVSSDLIAQTEQPRLPRSAHADS